MSKMSVYFRSPDWEALDDAVRSLSAVMSTNNKELKGFNIVLAPAEIDNERVMVRRVDIIEPTSKLVAKLSTLDFTKTVKVNIVDHKK